MEIYGLVVFHCGISPNYFFDEMCNSEVDVLLTEYNRSYQNTWEQTRFTSYIIAVGNGAKLTAPKDLITFGWEQDEKVKPVKMNAEEFTNFKEAMTQSVNNFEAGNVTEVKY